jgi:DNA mismatch repair protein MutL
MPIRILPSVLVDQIAAGEVVERPAAVVKELVENALDAGADQIEVTVNQAGLDKIMVRDNGHGMDKNDLQLAIQRHATSKLSDDNLQAIDHLGFRGEALPSIASVSRMTITSRVQGSDHAWQLSVDGGEVSEVQPASHPSGTTVTMRDLFFNTPARRKFLKTERTEKRHIQEMIDHLALAHPSVGFTLTIDDHESRQFTADQDIIHRISQVIGDDFVDNSFPVAGDRDDIHLQAWCGLPTYHRSTSRHLYLVINGRPIDDRRLYGAIKGAYRDVMPSGRWPVGVINLSVPADKIDVNVHPTKAEVRFDNLRSVTGLIVGAIKHRLAEEGHRAASGNQITKSFQQRQEHGSYSQMGSARPAIAGESETKFSGLPPSSRQGGQDDDHSAQADGTMMANDMDEYPLGAAQAQVHENYIISQSPDGFFLIDQHAAHERIVYERMKAALAENGVESQGLLMPEIIDLPETETELLLDHREELMTCGLEVDRFGPAAVAVQSVPALLGQKVEIKQLVRDILDQIIEWDNPDTLRNKLDEVCATMACYGSVRSGRRMNVTEMNALLRQMESLPNTGQCNHGRPTYISLSLAEIEKLFERR